MTYNQEVSLEELLGDPIVGLVMARDNVSASDFRETLDAARSRLKLRRTRRNGGNHGRPETQDGDIESRIVGDTTAAPVLRQSASALALTATRRASDRPRREVNGHRYAPPGDDRALFTPVVSPSRVRRIRRGAWSPAAVLALADHLTALNLYLAVALRGYDTESPKSEFRNILEKTAIQAARARSAIRQLQGERIMRS